MALHMWGISVPFICTAKAVIEFIVSHIPFHSDTLKVQVFWGNYLSLLNVCQAEQIFLVELCLYRLPFTSYHLCPFSACMWTCCLSTTFCLIVPFHCFCSFLGCMWTCCLSADFFKKLHCFFFASQIRFFLQVWGFSSIRCFFSYN